MNNAKITISNSNFITKEVIDNFVNRCNELKTIHAGCYRLGGDQGLSVYLYKKPNWLRRKLMAVFLGWEWIDNK